MTDAQACQLLIDRLSSGASVEAKDIYKHLSSDEALLLRQRLSELREQRKLYDEAKKELREYTQLLRIADLMYGRAERLTDSLQRRQSSALIAGRTPKVPGHKQLYNKAESRYESALERLSELLDGRHDLAIFFDRNFSWGANPGHETVSPDKDSMPRFAFPFANSAQIKIEVLREAVERANKGLQPETNTEADQQKLKSMLKALRK